MSRRAERFRDAAGLAAVLLIGLLVFQWITQAQGGIPAVLNHLDIARGLGHTETFNVSVYGLNDQVPNGSFEVVGPGSVTEYPWPAMALPIRVAGGGNPNDTDGGLGAWSVEVECLDANFNRDFHTLLLAGASPSAQSPRSCIRVNGAALSQEEGSVGTQGGSNIGTITIEQVGVGDVLRTISPGVGIDETFAYTVPHLYSALLLSYEIGVTANAPATLEVYRRPRADIAAAPFGAFSRIRRLSGAEGYLRHTLTTPPMFRELTDIFTRAQGMTGQTSVAVGIVFRIELKR